MRAAEAALRQFPAIAMALALLWAPLGAAADGFERTFALGPRRFDVSLSYADAAPGTAVRAGEGSVRTELPWAGQLTLRVPHLMGEKATLGSAWLGASYDLVPERPLLPSLGVVAHVDLPTAPGMRDARSGVKAVATKNLRFGIVDAVQLESEMWSDGAQPAPGHRAALRTLLRFFPATTGSLEIVSFRQSVARGVAQEGLAQLGLSQRLGRDTALWAGVAAHTAGPVRSIQATLGFHARF